jgi:hypothetical protein
MAPNDTKKIEEMSAADYLVGFNGDPIPAFALHGSNKQGYIKDRK